MSDKQNHDKTTLYWIGLGLVLLALVLGAPIALLSLIVAVAEENVNGRVSGPVAICLQVLAMLGIGIWMVRRGRKRSSNP